MATMDRPDNNDKRFPGSEKYDYLPSNYHVLSMESKFSLLKLKEDLIKASDNKYVMYEICMDAIALSMAQLQTFKKLMKEDGKLPKMPSADDISDIINSKKGE